MGTLRFLLALMVLLSHVDVRIGPLNPGVIAVIVFYLISGYVMAGLLHRHYGSRDRVPMFYADRVLRLFPQYLVYMGAALAWNLWTATPTLFLTRAPTWGDLFNNFTIVPLNFFMYNGADGYTLVPPAWSLGAELQFYLLAPFLLLFPRIGIALACASLAVHGAAMHGVLDTDWYGYRLLPGVLWVFAAGMLLFELRRRRPRLVIATAWTAPVAAIAVYLYLRSGNFHLLSYNTEVLLGWGLGIPAVIAASRLRPHLVDSVAGDLSYGMFLNHFLVVWVVFGGVLGGAAQLLALVCISMLLAWITHRWVEAPVLRWRRQLRIGGK